LGHDADGPEEWHDAQLTKKIVIFSAKYLRDYKNSHIFVVKD